MFNDNQILDQGLGGKHRLQWF